MKVCYAIRPSFYELMKRHSELLEYSLDMSKEQRELIFEKIDIHALMMSASTYFQSAIVMEDSILYLDHSVKQKQYAMECFEYFIKIDSEHNPFLPFVKRIFREICILECE